MGLLKGVQGNLLQQDDIKVLPNPLLDKEAQVSTEAPTNVVGGQPQQADSPPSLPSPSLPLSRTTLPAGRHLSCRLPPTHHC